MTTALLMSLVVGVFGSLASISHATIVIDPEAVTTESVYPKFPHAEAVKKKSVPLSGRLGVALMTGVARNNAYFDANTFSLAVDYHFNEQHGLQFYSSLFLSRPSSATEALNATDNLENLDLSPKPKFLIGVFYKITPWYGKISLTKEAVYNVSLQGNAGPAFFNIGGKFFPALNIGIGPQFYFKNDWGLAIGFHGLFYGGPDPLSSSVDLAGATSPPDAGLFDTTYSFNLLMNIGLSKLF